MKRNFFKFVAVTGVLLGGSLAASASERLKINVPFSFVMAGLEFQPGQYTVDQANNGVLTVQGEGKGAMVLTAPAESAKPVPAASLSFVTDGREYHLVGIKMDGEVSRSVSGITPQDRKLSIGSH